MYFSATSNHDQAFVNGTSNFRLPNVKRHANSAFHKKQEATAEAQAQPRESSQAQKALNGLNSTVLEQMKHKFRSCHALAKMGRPFTDFSWMNSLDEQKGLNIGNRYRSDKQAKVSQLENYLCFKLENVFN